MTNSKPNVFMESEEELKIIDFRSRPPFGSLTKDWIFSLEDKPGNPGLRTKYERMDMELPASLRHLSMNEFFSECEKVSIVHSVVPLRKLPCVSNEDLEKLLAAYPEKFTGFAGLQPSLDTVPKSLAELKRFVLHGLCDGVYLEPGLDGRPWLVDDEKFFPIYQLCEQAGIPVCFLYGGVFHKKTPPPYSIYDPARIERIAREFTGLRIMLSHACWPFAAHACAVALNWENVWLSPDGFMIDHPGSQEYIVAANYRLQDKIVFGSLYPSVSMEKAVQKYRQALRPAVWEKVFYKNAEKFLGRSFIKKSCGPASQDRACETA